MRTQILGTGVVEAHGNLHKQHKICTKFDGRLEIAAAGTRMLETFDESNMNGSIGDDSVRIPPPKKIKKFFVC